MPLSQTMNQVMNQAMSRRACLLLGLAHALADAGTGLMLFTTKTPAPPLAVFLLYNALAFACQPLAGWLIDEEADPRSGLRLGLMLLTAGLCLCAAGLPWGLLPAACGSAFFHAGAGALAGQAGLRASALFTAPGVLGLSLGTAAGLWGLSAWALAPLAILLLSAALALDRHLPQVQAEQASESVAQITSSAPIALLLLLLTAIALRSWIWDGCQLLLQGRPAAILLLGAGAALGKLLGGPLAEKWGWQRTAIASLLLAIPALAAGPASLPLLALGAGALQLSTPITLSLVVQSMKRRPATAAGLALGLSLALGGVPLLLDGSIDGSIDSWLPLLTLAPALLLVPETRILSLVSSHPPPKEFKSR